MSVRTPPAEFRRTFVGRVRSVFLRGAEINGAEMLRVEILD